MQHSNALGQWHLAVLSVLSDTAARNLIGTAREQACPEVCKSKLVQKSATSNDNQSVGRACCSSCFQHADAGSRLELHWLMGSAHAEADHMARVHAAL